MFLKCVQKISRIRSFCFAMSILVPFENTALKTKNALFTRACLTERRKETQRKVRNPPGGVLRRRRDENGNII